MGERDPVLISNTREWLARAREDLETAAFCLTSASPFIRSALFHSQQAVEKVMKAFLTWHDSPFRHTHNLLELGSACAEIDPRLISDLKNVSMLTKYASLFRYPGAPYEPTLREAQQSVALAGEFMDVILASLPPGKLD